MFNVFQFLHFFSYKFNFDINWKKLKTIEKRWKTGVLCDDSACRLTLTIWRRPRRFRYAQSWAHGLGYIWSTAPIFQSNISPQGKCHFGWRLDHPVSLLSGIWALEPDTFASDAKSSWNHPAIWAWSIASTWTIGVCWTTLWCAMQSTPSASISWRKRLCYNPTQF